MFRIYLLFAVVTVVIAVDYDMVIKNCGKLFHRRGKTCCKDKIGELSLAHGKFMKECMQLPSKPDKCAPYICMATKHGFGTDEGKLLLDKAEEILLDDFKAYPKLVAAFKEKCIKGDFTVFGLPDFCELRKFTHCVDLQMIDQCSEWSDDGDCEGIKDTAEGCVKSFA